MNAVGMILSKDATSFARMLGEQGVDLHDIAVCSNMDEVREAQDSSHSWSSVQWLMAEPSLAAEILPLMPNLRWLQSTWAGVEKLLALPRRDYVLTNIRGVFARSMGEYVLAHCLAHERKIIEHYRAQQQGLWFNDLKGSTAGTLRGKTLLVLGVGSIGLGVVPLMRSMGMRALGVMSHVREVPELDAVGTLAQLPELLPQADYVLNTLPKTADTVDLIGTDFLRQMKSSAVLINVGRGDAVVEADLAQALTNGIIAKAVLDVYRQEPLPVDHVFWKTPNVVLTSHTSAPSFPQDIFPVFWDNYQRFMAQQLLHHVVDFEKGY